jgi:undecaprenyl diphosphate synthase
MSDSPSISDAVIDNLITRKEIRADAIRRARARERIELRDKRTGMYNKLAEVNAEAPINKFIIKKQLDSDAYPSHIALIPDGNRRWASARGMTVGEGYSVGAEKITGFREWAMGDNGVDVATVFLMSTENIERRPEHELKQLYGVFVNFFNEVAEDPSVHENKIRHEVRGAPEAMERMPDEVNESIDNMESATEGYDEHRVVFLMPYGGRDEIVKAARNADSPLMDSSGVVVEDNGEDETQFREQLMLGDLPDVDLMMRTSEVRLSNFMLYHNAYAEFVFMQKNWPSFTESDFYESMYKYANRDRRFGV